MVATNPSQDRDHALEIECVHCEERFTIMVRLEDYTKWSQGVVLQLAMPYLSPEEAELCISGTCGKCWTRMFGGIEG